MVTLPCKDSPEIHPWDRSPAELPKPVVSLLNWLDKNGGSTSCGWNVPVKNVPRDLDKALALAAGYKLVEVSFESFTDTGGQFRENNLAVRLGQLGKDAILFLRLDDERRTGQPEALAKEYHPTPTTKRLITDFKNGVSVNALSNKYGKGAAAIRQTIRRARKAGLLPPAKRGQRDAP